MDWLQFIASVIGSVAWPTALLVVFFVIRKQLRQLLSRLIELHLPGGYKAKFALELARGQEAIEVTEPSPKAKSPTMAFDEMPSQLTKKEEMKGFLPHALILSAYDGILEDLKKARAALGLSEHMNLPSIIRALAEKKLVGGEMVTLFDSLRAARNAALHASQDQITQIEAEEYARQVAVLRANLRIALKKTVAN